MKKLLTQTQIEQLTLQGCTAQDWSMVHVDEELDINTIRHTAFDGEVTIGKDVVLDHVGLIKGYEIGNHVTICRVNELVADKTWSATFYMEGITVGNEAGDVNIRFKPIHHEKTDWAEMHYPQFQSEYADTGNKGLTCIAERSVIRNSGVICNVRIGKGVTIEGAAHLENGDLHEDCYIGTQVIAHKFSIGARTRITDGAKLYHVITTNDCKIGKGFMAENCYFGHHSELFCGEACAVFGGPHTVSHHKSTLLIGGEFSFYNAGSNTNQSNHAYKLGPVHHGTLARGSKTASGSHILWPMQAAPFTMVMGKVKTHPDLSALPFSYVIADGEKVYVAPGMNIGTAGTFRDAMKWRQRGKSPYIGEYDFLSPFVMQSVFKGIETLEALQQEYGIEAAEYPYKGAFIRHSALQKGLNRYRLAVRLYANKIEPTECIHETARDWHWTDLAGLPAVEEQLDDICRLLEKAASEDGENAINELNERYITQAQQWGAAMLAHLYGKDFTNGALQAEGKQALEEWKALLIADARKELALGDMSEELVEDFSEKVEKNSKEVL